MYPKFKYFKEQVGACVSRPISAINPEAPPVLVSVMLHYHMKALVSSHSDLLSLHRLKFLSTLSAAHVAPRLSRESIAMFQFNFCLVCEVQW